jgi:hypothetical protein
MVVLQNGLDHARVQQLHVADRRFAHDLVHHVVDLVSPCLQLVELVGHIVSVLPSQAFDCTVLPASSA